MGAAVASGDVRFHVGDQHVLPAVAIEIGGARVAGKSIVARGRPGTFVQEREDERKKIALAVGTDALVEQIAVRAVVGDHQVEQIVVVQVGVADGIGAELIDDIVLSE